MVNNFMVNNKRKLSCFHLSCVGSIKNVKLAIAP